MEALLDSAKQIATAHRETQRLAALQTDLDMLENGESIVAALELQEEESRNSAVEALEAAMAGAMVRARAKLDVVFSCQVHYLWPHLPWLHLLWPRLL